MIEKTINKWWCCWLDPKQALRSSLRHWLAMISASLPLHGISLEPLFYALYGQIFSSQLSTNILSAAVFETIMPCFSLIIIVFTRQWQGPIFAHAKFYINQSTERHAFHGYLWFFVREWAIHNPIVLQATMEDITAATRSCIFKNNKTKFLRTSCRRTLNIYNELGK